MTPDKMKRAMEICFEADVIPYFIGVRGVGKTTIVSDLAKEKGIGFIPFRLSQIEATDIIGMPRVVQRDTNKYVTEFILPQLFEEMEKYPQGGILFFDEINRAQWDVLQAIFQILLPEYDAELKKNVRKVNFHVVPENWHIVCAGNPDTEKYAVTTVSDEAFLDRVVQIPVEPNVKAFLKWAETNIKDKDITKWVASNPDVVSSQETITIIATPSGRSIEFLDRIVNVLNENDFKNGVALELFQGILGHDQGNAFYAFKKSRFLKPISVEEVKSGKFKKMMDKYIIKNDKGKITEIRTDLLDATLKLLVISIDKEKPTKKEAENILEFVATIPTDMGCNFFSEIANTEYRNILFQVLNDEDKKFEKAMKEWSLIFAKKIDPTIDLKKLEELANVLQQKIEEFQQKVEEEKKNGKK